MSGKRFSNEKAKKNGFYAALAICLMAVGVAAWSTYDAVGGYLNENGDISQAAESSAVSRAPATSSRSSNTDDGESVKRNETQSAVSGSAEETAGSTMESQVPQPTATPEPVQEESQVDAPVNTGVLYEISPVLSFPVASQEIVKGYSSGAPVFSTTMRDWRIHTGIDFQGELGETVKACANGQVLEVYYDNMLGNVVAVEHGDNVFYYCGLAEATEVSVGDIVSAGDSLGVLDTIPAEAEDGPHLHLEVKQDDVYLNPEDVLNNQADS